jgi:hypothetical protein
MNATKHFASFGHETQSQRPALPPRWNMKIFVKLVFSTNPINNVDQTNIKRDNHPFVRESMPREFAQIREKRANVPVLPLLGANNQGGTTSTSRMGKCRVRSSFSKSAIPPS